MVIKLTTPKLFNKTYTFLAMLETTYTKSHQHNYLNICWTRTATIVMPKQTGEALEASTLYLGRLREEKLFSREEHAN